MTDQQSLHKPWSVDWSSATGAAWVPGPLQMGAVTVVSATTLIPGFAEAETRFYPTTASTQLDLASRPLNVDYQGLGYALLEMNQADDDWKINDQVFRNACFVADKLRSMGAPTPKLFTHSSTSVVFDWTEGDESRYLTVSANCLSLLVSTSARIERRSEYPWRAVFENGAAAYLLADAARDVLSYKLLTAEIRPSAVSKDVAP